MKFLPRSSTLLLLTLAFSLSACATAANRRALYFPAKPGGLWHDYEARRLAEAQTGINTAAYPAGPTKVTPLPPSKPVPSGPDIASPPPSNGPTGQVPSVSAIPSATVDSSLPSNPATSAFPTQSSSDTSAPAPAPQ